MGSLSVLYLFPCFCLAFHFDRSHGVVYINVISPPCFSSLCLLSQSCYSFPALPFISTLLFFLSFRVFPSCVIPFFLVSVSSGLSYHSFYVFHVLICPPLSFSHLHTFLLSLMLMALFFYSSHFLIISLPSNFSFRSLPRIL